MAEFYKFANKHKGGRFLIIGLGESANELVKPGIDLSDVITIGVNDCDRLITPKYLIVIDDPKRFNPPDRATYMRNTGAEIIFPQLSGNWGWEEERKVPEGRGVAGVPTETRAALAPPLLPPSPLSPQRPRWLRSSMRVPPRRRGGGLQA